MWNPCHFWEDLFWDAFSWSDQNFKSRHKKLALFFIWFFLKQAAKVSRVDLDIPKSVSSLPQVIFKLSDPIWSNLIQSDPIWSNIIQSDTKKEHYIRLKSIVAHLGTKYPDKQQWKQIDKVDCRTAPTSIGVKKLEGETGEN